MLKRSIDGTSVNINTTAFKSIRYEKRCRSFCLSLFIFFNPYLPVSLKFAVKIAEIFRVGISHKTCCLRNFVFSRFN